MDAPRLKRQLVVAHSYEPLEWLKDVTIAKAVYSKGADPQGGAVKLPNVGREAHTYLHHVVENYDNLADLTFFVQGWPFDHSPDILERLKAPYWDTTSLTGWYRRGYHEHLKWAQRPQWHCGHNVTLFKCDSYGRPYGHFNTPRAGPKPLKWVWHELFDFKMPAKANILWFHAAMFAVPKLRIVARPKAFYERALQLVNDPRLKSPKFKRNGRNIGPWIFERLWLYIFDDASVYKGKPEFGR